MSKSTRGAKTRAVDAGNGELGKKRLGPVQRNCAKCNGIVTLSRRTPSLSMGNCAKCGRTYALLAA